MLQREGSLQRSGSLKKLISKLNPAAKREDGKLLFYGPRCEPHEASAVLPAWPGAECARTSLAAHVRDAGSAWAST